MSSYGVKVSTGEVGVKQSASSRAVCLVEEQAPQSCLLCQHQPTPAKLAAISGHKILASGKHAEKQSPREEATCVYLVFNYFPQNKLCDVTKYISNRVIF